MMSLSRIVELFWFALLLGYFAWVTHQSYTIIPHPPCDWWAYVKLPEHPPGLGKPQIALLAVFFLIFAIISFSLRSVESRANLYFALIIPIITVTIPLMGVVDLEIYGGCVQLGGPELSRYNSFDSLIIFLAFGSFWYVLVASAISLLIFATIYLARR